MTNKSVDWDDARDIAPLDIPSINKNMDDFMSSAVKAFIDGYRGNATFDWESIPGLEQKLALTTSEWLLIVIIVLDILTFGFLYALVRSAPTWKGHSSPLYRCTLISYISYSPVSPFCLALVQHLL